ncbi:MAG: hypothetical protein LWY06_17975 [Firmicutes bacterium]|nr:hypothetical protein [Bacillota bacterium]
MKNIIATVAAIVMFALVCAGWAVGEQDVKPAPSKKMKAYNAYKQVIEKTVNMVYDNSVTQLASKHGLNVLNVTWEDTGRYKGSSVGPNISDMTIQVQLQDPATEKYQLFCMPVIRFPNFSDKSCDIKPEKFFMLVGNEKGKTLKKINLKQFLEDPRLYLSKPESWKGTKRSLLAKRDTHVLVSAQACFLPIPQKGIAQFNPVLFNYQSYEKNPAVLTVLVTREGTSTTIIDNKRDAFEAGGTWGQRLFFNLNGKRTSLTGKRLSDFLAEQADKTTKSPNSKNKPANKKNTEGLNMVLLIQIPLKHKEMPIPPPCPSAAPCEESKSDAAPSARSRVENAVIGHGKVEGPYTEIDGLAIERDDRYPVRVTIQFYKATDNGVVTDNDVTSIASQIQKVYQNADYVGSLVTEGDTKRPTEYDGSKVEPPGWWDGFWKQYEEKQGISREQAMEMLRKLKGPRWTPKDKKELEKELKKI